MKHHFYSLIIACLPLISACSSGESTQDIPAVSDFNLNNYMGVWYEIARYPHSFEKNLSHVSAEYILRENNTVTVINRGRKNGKEKIIRGIAKSVKQNSGELKVSFFRPFYGAYRIIYLNKNYTLAIVTSSTKNFLWILAREKNIPENTLRELIRFIESKGFRKEDLIPVNQN